MSVAVQFQFNSFLSLPRFLLSRWLYKMKKRDLKLAVKECDNVLDDYNKHQSQEEELESLNPKSVSINVTNGE